MIPYFPNFAALSRPTTSAVGHSIWDQLFSIHQRVFQHSSNELWLSSARIVQEHATKAWTEASQACMVALAENAAAIQQRAFTELVGAQQQAAIETAAEITERLAATSEQA
jgi:deferrochelatase/peroxidase EfeB